MLLLSELVRVDTKNEGWCASVDERQWESVALVIVVCKMTHAPVGSFKSLGTIDDNVWIRISAAYVDGAGVGEMKSYMHEVRVNGLD